MVVTLPVWGPPLLVGMRLHDAVRHELSIGPVPKVTFTAPGVDIETKSLALPPAETRAFGPMLERPCNASTYTILPAPETAMLAMIGGPNLDVLDLSKPNIPVIASIGAGYEYPIQAASWDKSGNWLLVFSGTSRGALFHVSSTVRPQPAGASSMMR